MPTTTVQRKTRHQERLVARVSRQDKAIIAQAAALAGQSIENFIVAEARKSALQTLGEMERVVLSAEESRRFVEALLSPSRPPTPRMVEAMRAYKSSVETDLD
jgi:uncharacterized protein (DUF1778 family)